MVAHICTSSPLGSEAGGLAPSLRSSRPVSDCETLFQKANPNKRQIPRTKLLVILGLSPCSWELVWTGGSAGNSRLAFMVAEWNIWEWQEVFWKRCSVISTKFYFSLLCVSEWGPKEVFTFPCPSEQCTGISVSPRSVKLIHSGVGSSTPSKSRTREACPFSSCTFLQKILS